MWPILPNGDDCHVAVVPECFSLFSQYSNCAPRAILAVLFSLFFWHEGRAKPDSECQKNREKNQQHCPRRTYCLLHRRENTSFPAIGHEIGPKDENWRKKCLTCILFFFRQAAKKKKCACFFLPVWLLFSLSGGKIVGKTGVGGKIKDRKI